MAPALLPPPSFHNPQQLDSEEEYAEEEDRLSDSQKSTPPQSPAFRSQPINQLQTAGQLNGKKTKGLEPTELNTLIQSKICQLETDASIEEDSEKAIARAVRKANKELSSLVSAHDNHIDKINILQQKYTELFQDMKKLEQIHLRSRQKTDLLQKGKDSAKSEVAKANNVRVKLETLCRELQKENKRIKDESKRLARDEQAKREELSLKFESTIHEIKNKMEEEVFERKKSPMQETELLQGKFKSFLDQYSLREQHYTVTLRSKDLESKIFQAQFEKHRRLYEEEKEKTAILQDQISMFTHTETELRSQLNIYVEKFKQVEDTLNNSNDLFMTFRKEMEQMTKKTKKFEKENATLRMKHDNMHRNVIKMAEERTKFEKDIAQYQRKQAKLENLCRALQSERSMLEARLAQYEQAGSEEYDSDECTEDEECASEEDIAGTEDTEVTAETEKEAELPEPLNIHSSN
ncbi:Alpha-taxilin [Neolecta irregularis DAH-3]|uniref:Alpha-taxilin n=1 Tax=Neolecta irregularis (strain DAH-3) TaxID=1198029 RepID=A0A1U7LQJ6_NEOID|nr:Alpha-taxilin [Neolecta irregularis DAH-3]|eukprot:OLL24898.1 Alpha-taxilin [Neolecta irregularis DAH-3]